MSDYRLKSAAAALVACAAWTSVSIATQDGGDPDNACKPAQYCWDEYICVGIWNCFGPEGFDTPDLQMECWGVYGEHPSGEGSEGWAGLYQTCMLNVCPEGWGRGIHEVTTAPTLAQCADIYRQTVSDCKRGWRGQTPFGCEGIPTDPDLVPSELVQKMCLKAARIQLEFCKANATDAPGNTNFMDTVVPLGAADSGQLDPANGVTDGAWVKVPGVDGDEPVDGARVEALVRVDGDWAWVLISETGADPDGMIVPDFRLSDIDGHASLEGIELLIEWTNQGQTVRYTPVSMDFADTANGSDFNRDGSVDAADVAAYIDAYEAQVPRADLNGDGAVDLLDFDLFVSTFGSD